MDLGFRLTEECDLGNLKIWKLYLIIAFLRLFIKIENKQFKQIIYSSQQATEITFSSERTFISSTNAVSIHH